MQIDNSIKGFSTPIVKEVGSSNAPASARNQAHTSVPTAVSDTVRLTETAEQIRQLERNLAQLDVSDEGKVASVRKSIEDGTFKIDEAAIAEGMIQQTMADLAASYKP
jgi:flagellar biosynthesis anti-sigma factor FlgM